MPVIVNKLGEHRNEDAVQFLIHYMALSGYAQYSGGRGIISVGPTQVVQDFAFVKGMYGKGDRKQVSHIIIGTGEQEMITGADLMGFGEYIAEYLYQKGFQSFYVVHSGSAENPTYHHLHLAVNTINYLNGTRYYETYGNASDIKNAMQKQFQQYGWFLINDNSLSWEE